MDIEALIKNLEALNDSLKSDTIRENDDFHDCVKGSKQSLRTLFVFITHLIAIELLIKNQSFLILGSYWMK